MKFITKFTPGKLLYLFFYKPRGYISLLICAIQLLGIRGYINYLNGKIQMKRSIKTIEINHVYSSETEKYKIYYLTGKNFWYQTCFCAYSLIKNIDINVSPVIYDDGTLNQYSIEQIKRLLPSSEIILFPEIESIINRYLPERKYPVLRYLRNIYPNIKKLTDIHIDNTGWNLVIDSDMLFFNNPVHISKWMKNTNVPIHLEDIQTSYGYSDSIMNSLVNDSIYERVNVGICGLNSDELDWDIIENYCKTLIDIEGMHYFLEQAVVALIMTNYNPLILPKNEYLNKPGLDEILNPSAILHHYVAESKYYYHMYAWKHLIN